MGMQGSVFRITAVAIAVWAVLLTGTPLGSQDPPENDPADEYGSVKPRIARLAPVPSLPESLSNQKVEGLAIFTVFINHRGKFQKAVPAQSSGIPGLDEYLISWMGSWEFNAATFNDFPLASSLVLKIRYDLMNRNFGVLDLQETESDLINVTQSDEAAPPEPAATVSPEPVPAETEPEDIPERIQTPEPSDLPAVQVAQTPPQSPPEALSEGSDIPDCYEESRIGAPPEIIQPPRITAIPLEIQNLNASGSAEFALMIQADGTVSDVSVTASSGIRKLDEWFMPLLSKTLWEPARKGKLEVACRRVVKIEFKTSQCLFEFPDLFRSE